MLSPSFDDLILAMIPTSGKSRDQSRRKNLCHYVISQNYMIKDADKSSERKFRCYKITSWLILKNT